MAGPKVSPLQQQVARVGRRLFVQTLLTSLAWCWSAALVLTAAWFVAQPIWFGSIAGSWRMVVAGGLIGVATVAAVVLAVLWVPSKVAAALLLDERFGLKERVTTSVTLAPEQWQTAAGQALLADVNQRLAKLEVGPKFPVHVPWAATIVPVCAAVLAVAAYFYEPPQTLANIVAPEKTAQVAANAKEIEQKINRLKKQAREQRPPDKKMSDDLKRIEAELEKIANKPHQTKPELRERIKELTALEEQMKSREKEMAAKSQAVKSQLDQLNRMSQQAAMQDGPAKDLHHALAKGDLNEAQRQIEKLAKKLKDNELTQKEKEQLAKQMKDLQQKLERLAQNSDKEKQLKELNKQGKLDADTLQRELAKLKEDGQKLKDFQKLANQMAQCQKKLQAGDADSASKSLSEAGEQMAQMEMNEQELQDLRESLQRLQEAKDSC